MTNRGKLLKALRREGMDTVPLDLSLCPSQVDAFEKRFGHRDYETWFDLFHRTSYDELTPRFSDGHSLYRTEALPREIRFDSWGVGHSKGSEAAMHMTRMHHPLSGIVIGPTHLVEPEVPWENPQALFDEARSWPRQ